MTIRKRYGKYYYTDFYVRGKRIAIKVPGGITDKRFAQEYENDLKLKMLKGEIGLPGSDRDLEPLIGLFLDYSQTNKAPSSFKRDELALRTFTTITGFSKLSQVTPRALEKYKSDRLKSISKRSVNIEIKTLKAMFNRLVKMGEIKDNPVKSVPCLSGADTQKIEFLDEEEIKALLQSASPTMQPIIYAFLKTGLRRGELVHLEWDDIDFRNRQINVVNNDAHQTKWHRERHIPIDDKLLEILRSLPRKGKYVFPTKDGALRKNNLLRELKRAARLAGISKDVTLHMLRHTFASHLVINGVSLRVVKELLGHSNISTTLRYSHLGPEHLNGAVEKLPF